VGTAPTSHCFLCGIPFGFVLPIFRGTATLYRSSGLAILMNIPIGCSEAASCERTFMCSAAQKNGSFGDRWMWPTACLSETGSTARCDPPLCGSLLKNWVRFVKTARRALSVTCCASMRWSSQRKIGFVLSKCAPRRICLHPPVAVSDLALKRSFPPAQGRGTRKITRRSRR
jgi:hypothetical protein